VEGEVFKDLLRLLQHREHLAHGQLFFELQHQFATDLKKGDASVLHAINCRPTAHQRYLKKLVLQSVSLLFFIDQHIKIEQVLNYFDEGIVPGRFLCRLEVLL
jgi:hypothetical protein